MTSVLPRMGRACYDGGTLHVLDPDTMACLECKTHENAKDRHDNLAANEPPPGSVVLTDGWSGMAWQRMFSNPDLWARVLSHKTKTWAELMATNRPGPGGLRLIYIAPLRD